MGPAYRPVFQRSARLLSRLVDAAAVRAWIQEQSVDVSWIAHSQRDALVRLAHFSTRIEGNPLTLPEVEALAAGKDLPVEESAKREVLNYFAALRWVWTKSAPREVRERDILGLHRVLTDGVLPKAESGAYKQRPNVVYGGGRVIYRPPPPEAAQILTKGLLAWLSSGTARSEHAVVVAAIAHHRLVSIHPFMDGNGRLARALESWLLFRRGFDTHHIFALDEFFDQDRPRYYYEIQRVREQGEDLTAWLEYVSEGVLETLRKTQRRIQAIRSGKPGKRLVLTQRQERILQILASTPRLGGGELARTLGIGRSRLSKVLRPLLDGGLIEKEGATRAAAYRLPG